MAFRASLVGARLHGRGRLRAGITHDLIISLCFSNGPRSTISLDRIRPAILPVCPMRNIVKAIVESPAARTLVVLVLVIPLSVYLGTSPVRRGILYYSGVFAPSLVLGIAVGLWTWSWKWFGYALAIGIALTALTQSLVYLFW